MPALQNNFVIRQDFVLQYIYIFIYTGPPVFTNYKVWNNHKMFHLFAFLSEKEGKKISVETRYWFTLSLILLFLVLQSLISLLRCLQTGQWPEWKEILSSIIKELNSNRNKLHSLGVKKYVEDGRPPASHFDLWLHPSFLKNLWGQS